VASEDRETVHPLIRELETKPHEFSFFRAIWLLERAQPGAASLGRTGPVGRESARLRPSSSLAFPSADVSKIERRTAEGPRYEVTSSILGLYGATSPLPSFYSADIAQREAMGEVDPARLLLDVVNHRVQSLLYRAWSKYRWEWTFEPGARDQVSQYLMGLLGLAVPELQERVGLPAGRLLRYSGAISQRPRNAQSVSGVVSDYFDGIPVQLEQCVSRWVKLAPADRNAMGRANSALGQDLIVGGSILDRMGKCRIVLGPLHFDRYQEMRPGGRQHDALIALARFLLPDGLLFDLLYLVDGQTVPATRLVSSDDATRLGWSSWVLSEQSAAPKRVLFHASVATSV
jgi:type VI secretion system protein ImpH